MLNLTFYSSLGGFCGQAAYHHLSSPSTVQYIALAFLNLAMVHIHAFAFTTLISSGLADWSSHSEYGSTFSRRELALVRRGDIADIIDKSPNIKTLVAPYRDIVDDLIQRDDYGLQIRNAERLYARDIQLLALRQLRRRIARANAQPRTSVEGNAFPELGAEDASLHIGRYAGAFADPEAEAMPEANMITNVLQGNMDNANRNSRREAQPNAIADPDANIFTNVFQGSVDNTNKNNKRGPDPEPGAESGPNVLTTVFQENVDGAKHNKRKAAPQPMYERNANLFTRMFKAGSDLLSGISGFAQSFNYKRDATPDPQLEKDDLFSRDVGFEVEFGS